MSLLKTITNDLSHTKNMYYRHAAILTVLFILAAPVIIFLSLMAVLITNVPVMFFIALLTFTCLTVNGLAKLAKKAIKRFERDKRIHVYKGVK